MRLVFASLGFIGVFIASPWLVFACALVLSLRWRAWEVIALGVLVDALWLPSVAYQGLPLATLLSIALVWLLEPFRSELLLGRSV